MNRDGAPGLTSRYDEARAFSPNNASSDEAASARRRSAAEGDSKELAINTVAPYARTPSK
jgi:hypothetical protein